jgi:c-di-GMP-binding flagellar brake protein YcgR
VPTGKRKHYRLSLSTPAMFKIVSGKDPQEQSPALKGELKDISLGGIQFGTSVLRHEKLYIFNEFERKQGAGFKPNEILVKFSLPGEEKSFVLQCLPRWYAEGFLTDPHQYYIGAQYTRAKTGDGSRLRHFILTHGDREEVQKYAQKRKREESKSEFQSKVGPQANKYARVTLPIRYRIVSEHTQKQSRTLSALAKNLSLNGLCAQVEAIEADDLHMVFDESPLKRNLIQLDLTVPGHKQPVTILGEVRWFERTASEDRYQYNVGIKFLKIAENDRLTIADYIKDKPEDTARISRRW